MQDNSNKQHKWIAIPPSLKISQQPFLKGKPINALANNKIQYEVQTQNGKSLIKVSIEQAFDISNHDDDFQDMCQMSILNEPQVLNNLVKRYKRDQIFTYIGPTLIVMNPYKILKQFFSQQAMIKIRDKIMEQGSNVDDSHVYTIAGKAFKSLLSSRKKQAIVISGESGAGKTQSTKYCMQMLTSLSHKKSQSIEAKILACNPLLEAFGNSKTVRNDNSSRFGKYVQIYFGDDNHIKGASILSYLLEKSRVVSISKNQRSFHAFYALTSSNKYGVKPPQNYEYLKQSGCYTASNMNDSKYFNEINESMTEIGFSQKQIQKIWFLIKAILLLGNLQFDDQKHQQNQSNPCHVKCKDTLKQIAEALSIDIEKLQKLLLFQRKKFLKQFTLSAYNKIGCIGHRNTLSKAIYNAIFEFILFKIQISLNPKEKHKYGSINILDIFGFQNFQHNSFEQLCINFTNQKLLKLYNKYIFERQMQLLKEDGLGKAIQSIKPPTNDEIINLINDNKISIFSIINDFTPQQQYQDSNMMNGFKTKLAQQKNIKFNKLKDHIFTVQHSQCQVQYDINGFKVKNLDRVNIDVEQVVIGLFQHKSKDQTGKTLLSKFSNEIQELIKQLSSSNVHFIRCIKPNQTKTPSNPINSYVLTQVRYLGVFETIQIRKKTFPSRKSYQQFVKEYSVLFPGTKGADKIRTKQMIKQLKCTENEYMLGTNRVYINQRIQDLLNQMIYQHFKLRNQQIKKLQQVCRRYTIIAQITRNVKLIVKRKNIWRKWGEKKKIQILKENYSKIKVFSDQKLKLQIEQQKKKKAIKEKAQKQEKEKNNVQLSTKNVQLNKKKLDIINQKFFKYGTKIAKAHLKMSLTIPFSMLKNRGKKPSIQNQAQLQASNLNQTMLVQKPEPKRDLYKKPIMKKQQSKQSKQHKFSESFYEQNSVYITQGNDRLFTGNLKIDMFQNTKQKMQQLQILRNILNEKNKPLFKQGQLCSPASEDGNFKIQDCPNEIMNRIISFPIQNFFAQALRKRTTFIGLKKYYTDILIYKPKPLNKSLTQLQGQEQSNALKVFKLLIKISQQNKLDNVFKLVESVILYCQQTSSALKNQIFLQLLKQSNNPSQVAANRIYQTFSVFLHIYTPDQDYIFAGLYLMFSKLGQKKFQQKQEQYVRYLFKKMIRKIQKPHGVGYMPIKYQMMALMSKRQISVPIYFPIGNSVLVKVQSYQTFGDIKQKALLELGINIKRIPAEFFAFFEVINFENEELQQSPVSQNSLIWDVMTYWELAKVKYEQSGISPPSFFIMIKVKYPFQCLMDDQQAIQIYFAQCYFDYSLGRIKLEISQMGLLAACIKIVKNQAKKQEVQGCFPFWMIKKYGDTTLRKYMLDNLHWIQENLHDLISIKYRFLEVCSESPLALTFAVPTQHAIKIFLKPKRVFLVEKGIIVSQYSIRQIAKWSNDKEKFTFQIKKKDGSLQNKTHMIYSEYAQMCTQYLNKVSQLLMKYGGRSKASKDAKILQGL